MEREEKFLIFEKLGQTAFNLNNWTKIVSRAIPEGTEIGVKQKVNKEQIIAALESVVDELRGLRDLLNDGFIK